MHIGFSKIMGQSNQIFYQVIGDRPQSVAVVEAFLFFNTKTLIASSL